MRLTAFAAMCGILLASCGGRGTTPMSVTPRDANRDAVFKLSQQSAASCSVTQLADGTKDVLGAVGSSTTDAWAIENDDMGLGATYGALVHFVNGIKVATYTVPADRATVRFTYINRVRLIGGVPWVIGTYATRQGVTTNYAGRFDGSKIVPYPFPSSSYSVNNADIGGSLSTGLYLAVQNAKNQIVLNRFNGSAFVPLATEPYTGLAINNILVFGKDVYFLVTEGVYAAAVGHWNGSSFAFHELQYGAYKGNGVELTGTSPTDLWAVTATGIWHDNGNWQPYAYQTNSTATPYMEGIAEFNPKYVAVTTMMSSFGQPSTAGALVYNGVERFLPLNIVNPNSPRPIFLNNLVPGTTAFYGTYGSSNPNNAYPYSSGLVSCPTSPPA